MLKIAADNVTDSLRIGFAIGAGCLVGTFKQDIMMCVCELLLEGGYKKQYNAIKRFSEDLDLDINNDAKRRYLNFTAAVISIQLCCSEIFEELKRHFIVFDIDIYGLREFMRINNESKILDLLTAVNECLVHFESCTQIPGMFSDICTKHLNQINTITDEHLSMLAPMLVLLKYDYQYIPCPLEFNYNSVTVELEIEMPKSTANRGIN